MAEFRQIHTRIWKDSWFSDLEMDAKLLFIYLFSNERASVSGIYELPLKYLVFETGMEKSRVEKILAQFQKAKKVYYESGIVWVVNLRKYNETTSDKVQTRLNKDIASIPDSNILRLYCQHYKIPYPHGMDTLSENGFRDRDGDGNRDGDGKETEIPAPPNPIAEAETKMLEMWRVLFPSKPQPRAGTYRDKIAARWKEQPFRDNWQAALEKASKSPTLQEESWFCFEFLVKNEKNYQKMLDGWMNWKDQQRMGNRPATPPVEIDYTKQREEERIRAKAKIAAALEAQQHHATQ